MKISKYNSEGYYDPTNYEAFMNIEREKKQAQLDRLASSIRGYKPLVYICSHTPGTAFWSTSSMPAATANSLWTPGTTPSHRTCFTRSFWMMRSRKSEGSAWRWA